MNDFNEKMQFYRQRKARNISLAVMGYFIGVVCIIGCTVFWYSPIAGVLLFLVICAASTGLIIYTKMSTPLEFTEKYRDEYDYDECGEGNSDGAYDGYSTRDVSTETANPDEAGNSSGASYAKADGNRNGQADSRYYMKRRPTPSERMFKQILEIYWLLVTVIYFAVSFLSGRWGITWLIWLIGVAVERAIHIIWETRRFDGNKR